METGRAATTRLSADYNVRKVEDSVERVIPQRHPVRQILHYIDEEVSKKSKMLNLPQITQLTTTNPNLEP